MKKINLRELYPDVYTTDFFVDVTEEVMETMMDNPEYARAAIRKIESYEKNGIYPGENLILTFETQQNVLDFKIIEEMIDRYLQ